MNDYVEVKTGHRSYMRYYPKSLVTIDYYTCVKKYVAYIKYIKEWYEIARADNKKDMNIKLDELYANHIIR